MLTETLDAVGSGAEQIATKFTYDAVGNLLERIEDAGVGRINVRTAFEYDKLNRVSRELTYRSATDMAPTETFFTYDAHGNLVESINYVHHPQYFAGQIVWDRFTYDALNRQTAVTRDATGPLATTSTTAYDAVGNAVAQTDGLGRTTTSEYDRLDRLVKVTAPDPDGAGSLLSPVSSFTYDVMGRLVVQTNGENETQETDYDVFGRVIATRDGLGSQTGHETRITYDTEGNRLTYTDPEGNVTRYAYDNLNRLKSETIKLNNVDKSRTYKYNAQGNLEETIDRNGRKRTFTYDRLDRQVTERWYDPTLVHVLSWQYDKLGRVTSHTDDGTGYTNVVVYEYDHLGRVTKQISGDTEAAGVPYVEQRWEHDVLLLADASQYVRTNYLQFTTDDGVNYTPVGSTTYFTDRLGRTAKLVDNAVSQSGVTAKTIEFTYDAADQLTGIARTAEGGSFRFDTSYAYDRAGRVTNIAHRRPTASATPFTTYAYTYDKANRIDVQTTAHDSAISAFSAVTSPKVEDFTFDDAGQLEVVNSNLTGQDESFEYDQNGNREDSTDNGTTVIGAYNRLLSDEIFTYTYDHEGNLTRKAYTGGSGYVDYTWDHRNRLVKVETYFGGNPFQRIAYRYNAADQLVFRELEELSTGPFLDFVVTEYHTYSGDQRALTFDDQEQLKHRYTWGPGTDQLLVDEAFAVYPSQTSHTLWGANDHVGTVQSLLNSAGDVVVHREYESFGEFQEVFHQIGSTTSEVGFQGLFHDQDAGHLHNRARILDPLTNRFSSVDPIEDGANWYVRTGNDPHQTDPTGLRQAGNPLNNLFGPQQTFLDRPYALAPSAAQIGRASLPASNPFAGPIRPTITSAAPSLNFGPSFDFVDTRGPARGPVDSFANTASLGDINRALTRPTSSLTDVQNTYFKSLGSDTMFRNAVDDYYARENVRPFIERGTPLQAFAGQLALTLNDISGPQPLGYGEIADAQVLFGRESSLGQRTLAGGSLLVSLLTAGESPNAGPALRGAAFDTHTFNDLVNLQQYTRQIDVLPNNGYFSQIDTLGNPSGQLGRQGENIASQITGGTKNTQKFTVNGRSVIPDQVLSQNVVTKLPGYVVEVKNKLYQAYTRQLKDLEKLVGPNGIVDVFLPPNAKVSGPLQNAFEGASPLNRVDLANPR